MRKKIIYLMLKYINITFLINNLKKFNSEKILIF